MGFAHEEIKAGRDKQMRGLAPSLTMKHYRHIYFIRKTIY